MGAIYKQQLNTPAVLFHKLSWLVSTVVINILLALATRPAPFPLKRIQLACHRRPKIRYIGPSVLQVQVVQGALPLLKCRQSSFHLWVVAQTVSTGPYVVCESADFKLGQNLEQIF